MRETTTSEQDEVNEDINSESSDLPMSSALKDLLELHEQMEQKKEAAIRQITEEKAHLTEAYQAKIAKLDTLLKKIAPELFALPPISPQVSLQPSPQLPPQLPQRTHSRAVAFAVASGRSAETAKWNGAKFCPFCQIQGHDGRAHRGQSVPKKWTKAELAIFGYLPPLDQPQLPANYDQIKVTAAPFSR